MYSDGTPDVVTRDMTKMCSYAAWASQEIICDRNYMEVQRTAGCMLKANIIFLFDNAFMGST